MNINEIQSQMRAAGSHWWDPDTMRFFGTRVASAVFDGPGGVFFVTRDKRHDHTFGYTVRQYDATAHEVHTVGDLGAHLLADARREALSLAAAHTYKGEAAVTDRDTAALDVHKLMRLARKHHSLCEDQCNGVNMCPHCGGAGQLPDPDTEDPYGLDCEPCGGSGVRGLAQLQRRILATAERLGAKGVRFSGDPRGCTVKLIFHDGATNDFGREGWCVPMKERAE